MALNGEISPSIILRRSIRQGCPLAPLLFVIVADALGWLIRDAITAGHTNGLNIPGAQQDLCLQQFADDTNAFLQNDPQTTTCFLKCLDTLCKASGSVVIHSKTGVWTSSGDVTQCIANLGCKTLKEGTIFRLLGIPMGFGVSFRARWAWVMDRINSKMLRWKGYQQSLASRLFVLNHFILTAAIYFLSCWRPPEAHIKNLMSFTSSFLWGGDGNTRKIAKVSINTCFLPKSEGGLGLLDIKMLASKLATKWIVRAIESEAYWTCLIKRNCYNFQLRDLKAWKGFSPIEIFISRRLFCYKGSLLIRRMWEAWDKFRPLLCIRDSIRVADHILSKESLWIGLTSPNYSRTDLLKAHKLFKLGFGDWSHVTIGYQWDAIGVNNLPSSIRHLLLDRILAATQRGFFPAQAGMSFTLASCYWPTGQNILSFPLLPQGQDVAVKLNDKWGIN